MQLLYRNAKPIHDQIKDAIRQLTVMDVVRPNERIPSIREISIRYTINPKAVARAYAELEAEGVIYIIDNEAFVSDEKMREVL